MIYKKLVYLLVPEELEYSMLTESQLTAVNMVMGEPRIPMSGTIPYNGYKVVQALVLDGFDPTLMPEYGIDWEILALFKRTGSEITELIPLDRVNWLNYLPYITTQDDEGNVISTSPPVFKIPSIYGGWEELLEY